MTDADVWTIVLSGIAALAVVGVPFAIWSLAVQRRSEARDLEPRDIVWSASRYDDESGWWFEHSGSTDAIGVKIDLTIDGRTETARHDRIAPDTPVEIKHAWHSELIAEASREAAQYEREVEELETPIRAPGPFGSMIELPGVIRGGVPVPAMARRVEAVFVVNWRSPLGRPDRQERSWTESY